MLQTKVSRTFRDRSVPTLLIQVRKFKYIGPNILGPNYLVSEVSGYHEKIKHTGSRKMALQICPRTLRIMSDNR